MKEESKKSIGKIISIDGPVVGIAGLIGPKVGDIVKIGNKRLVGEVIKLIGKKAIAQCYDYTEGLKIYEPVENTNFPLSMELGPGLLNTIFDGIQRPLEKIDSFIKSGLEILPLSREKKWNFKPLKKIGDQVSQGDIIGEVQETKTLIHKIMVPFGLKGKISSIEEGGFTLEDEIYTIIDDNKKNSLTMLQKWSIRNSRPYRTHIYPDSPLVTGMRVVDLLYPVARGGSVAIPGGFGTGKTVTQHNLAKFADADIIVYIGCGERGNELADVLNQFPKLTDPRTKRPIMERTILIGNTSNMPVSAREASIFSGLTMAEYYRDMGYHVALLADSTSRWAEALREISGRLEEMPTEGGYPAYLATRLANFYERAGYIVPYGLPDRSGSITLVGAVSPPSGDFSEPVTKTTKRFIRAFWALDAKLAYSRHYPSISWVNSYSLYDEFLEKWWQNIGTGWKESRNKTSEILSQSDELQNIVQLMGKENLPNDQQLILFVAELIKNSFLIQNAFDEVDRYCSPEKTLKLIKIILLLYENGQKMLRYKIPLFKITSLPIIEEINRAKSSVPNDKVLKLDEIEKELMNQFKELEKDII
ncbi:MAG: V-type ATP synthase subunit A [archaeon]|nr:V-type ATP synthase subunit A [archaeon]